MFQLLLLLFLVSFGSKNILIALLDSKHIWANVSVTTTHPALLVVSQKRHVYLSPNYSLKTTAANQTAAGWSK